MQKEIKIGMYIHTPRFLTVKIENLYTSEAAAIAAGYQEPTHYEWQDSQYIVDGVHNVLGKSLDLYHMEFAAVVAVDELPENAARLREEFRRANPGVVWG